MRKPSIGITGVTHLQQADEVMEILARNPVGVNKEVRIGYLISQPTVRRLPVSSYRYPIFDEIPEMMQHTARGAVNVADYRAYDGLHLDEQVIKVFRDIRQFCDVVQISSGRWPRRSELDKIKKELGLEIILRLPKYAVLSRTNHSLACEILEYKGGVIDGVSIDKGPNFSCEASAEVYREVKRMLPGLRLIFTGGITGRNVRSIVLELMNRLRHSDFSVDSRQGLRTNVDGEWGRDYMDPVKVEDYLVGWNLAFNTYNQVRKSSSPVESRLLSA